MTAWRWYSWWNGQQGGGGGEWRMCLRFPRPSPHPSRPGGCAAALHRRGCLRARPRGGCAGLAWCSTCAGGHGGRSWHVLTWPTPRLRRDKFRLRGWPAGARRKLEPAGDRVSQRHPCRRSIIMKWVSKESQARFQFMARIWRVLAMGKVAKSMDEVRAGASLRGRRK